MIQNKCFQNQTGHVMRVYVHAIEFVSLAKLRIFPLANKEKGNKKGINSETACPFRDFYVILHLCNYSSNKRLYIWQQN
jgi:hypothetical protein